MTDPNVMAQGIVNPDVRFFLKDDQVADALIKIIAAALREYGEAEYKRGVIEQQALESQVVKISVNAMRERADAEGYRRGRKECLDEQKCKDCGCSYEKCCCNPIREMDAYRRGVEEAAKVVEEGCNDEDLANCPDCGNLDGKSLTERIRALALAKENIGL